MSFITYAQNCEDVLLWRALKSVKNGFYIDVGANDPELHSVTKAFYDAGWWGINIEPMPSYAAVFAQARPRDINLALAAGAEEGEITLFDTPAVNGWASTDAAVARAHRAEGVDVVETTVPLRTLNAICAEHVRGDIHFLKIDVEGFEGEVLRGLDLARWRPWILVVEATLPGSRETNHETWEGMITPHGYQFAYFDGLNRYYVADEQRALLPLLDVQANVFDEYISHHLDKAWRRTEEVHQQGLSEAASLREHVRQAQARGEEERARGDEALRRGEEALRRGDEALRQAEAAAASLNAALASNDMTLRQAIGQAEQRVADYAARCQAALEQAGAARQEAEEQTRLAQDYAISSHHAGVEVQRLQQQNALQHTQLQAAGAWGADLERRLLAIEASWRWRLARPVELALTLAGRLRRGARRASVALVTRLKTNEAARRLLVPLIRRYPEHAARVLDTMAPKPPPPPYDPSLSVEEAAEAAELGALPVSVRHVLADLEHAVRHPSN